jgi:cbb3-type cytochrome oxidase subunit 3
METIGGIDIYPLVSLTIFFLFFTGLLIWVWRSDKTYIEESANMPLGDDNEEYAKIFSRYE